MAKTANSNMGLGEVRSSDRKHRNKRVKKIHQRTWKAEREAFFKRNLRFAAAAKGYRLVWEVTQKEIAKYYNRSQGTVCNWESGKYSWPGGQAELDEYLATIQHIGQN